MKEKGRAMKGMEMVINGLAEIPNKAKTIMEMERLPII